MKLPYLETLHCKNNLIKKSLSVNCTSGSRQSMTRKQSYLSCVLLSCVSLSAYSQETSSTEDLEVKPIKKVERIAVLGGRLKLNSEPTEETIQLMNVAGIDGDPLAATFSLPGVVFAGDDVGGEPAVRGSSPMDNAFYIDGVPATYIFHLFGNSIFHQNLIQDFQLHSGAFDASYGNATGAVFDVRLRDGREQPITTTLETSFLRAGVLVEGSHKEDHSFYAAYRHSLLHLFFGEGEEGDDGVTVFEAPKSTDYQLKYSWLLNNDHKLTFSANGASDKGGINISATSEEGRLDPLFIGDASLEDSFNNAIVNHQWVSDYGVIESIAAFTKTSRIQRYGDGQFIDNTNNRFDFRTMYRTPRGKRHQFTVGLDAQINDIDYRFDAVPEICTEFEADCLDRRGQRVSGSDKIDPTFLSLYLIDKYKLSDDVELELGFRAENDSFTKKTFIHPRVGLSYNYSNQLRLFSRAGTYSRFPDIENIAPTFGNARLKPYESKQVSVGAEYEFVSPYTASIDVYYKDLSSLARASDDPDSAIRYTNDYSGTSYGAELLVQREKQNNWDGWLSFSYAKTDRKDELTNRDVDYFLDTPWIVNGVMNYEWSDAWTFAARFTARAGAKYTPIVGIEPNPNFPDFFIATYGQENSATLPTYFRLDLQARYQTKTWGLPTNYTFGIINATASDNTSGFYFKPDGNETPDNFIIEKEEGMGLFPTLGIEITF